MKTKKLDTKIDVRLSSEDKKALIKKAEYNSEQLSEVIRGLIKKWVKPNE
jgi:predicted DNA binding CopG/RHH family protein